MDDSKSKYQDLYKNNSKDEMQQEARRKILLTQQKLQRSAAQDAHRNVKSVFKKSQRTSGSGRNKFRTFQEKYQCDHQLQLSEWLKERPVDLSSWLLVPCPKGKRCMVVAYGGFTEMYNKSGRQVKMFQSLLPGNSGPRNAVTILDCVFVESKSTFYVLDALSFGNQDLLNCDTEFRFFWLKSKFSEGDFDSVDAGNEYAFELLNFYDFDDAPRVSEVFQQYPLWEDDSPELDGFLFYHKEASYTCGTTPLVGWLFGFMVPEVLGFPVNASHLKQKPDDYTDYICYIEKFDKEMARKQRNYERRQAKRNSAMDEDCSTEQADDDSSLKAVLNAEMELELEDNG